MPDRDHGRVNRERVSTATDVGGLPLRRECHSPGRANAVLQQIALTIEKIKSVFMLYYLNMKTEDSDYEAIVNRAVIIWESELDIDTTQPVYLITWSPDPKEMPDCDFDKQHLFNVSAIVTYLKSCSAGVFCVESSQLGHPHYHGWYQVDSSKEVYRIAQIKVLQRFGLVKITKMKTEPKINKWYEKGNGLYYYKKDLLDSMLTVQCNPITANTPEPSLDFMQDYFVLLTSHSGRKSVKQLEEKVSQYKFYREFYSGK